MNLPDIDISHLSPEELAEAKRLSKNPETIAMV
jgi:hypothetical protein